MSRNLCNKILVNGLIPSWKTSRIFVIGYKTSDEKTKVNEKEKVFIFSNEDFGAQKTYF